MINVAFQQMNQVKHDLGERHGGVARGLTFAGALGGHALERKVSHSAVNEKGILENIKASPQ